MFSYIVGILAIGLFLINPISQILFPNSHHKPHLKATPRPQLNESLLAIDAPNATAPICPPDTYVAHILRTEPLVVYLEDFLSPSERTHLLAVSAPLYERSTTTSDGGSTLQSDLQVRDSQVALVPRTDEVRCVERRALGVQGWRRDVWLERLRTQRYDGPAGHYAHHFDWSANSGGWGRVSSFMAWVDDGKGSGSEEELEGGGTEFPLLETRGDWCRFVECDEKEGEKKQDDENNENDRRRTVFKVMPGNAVYWENFGRDGRGYEETWHAGLPVKKGVKVGLNIWTFGRIE